MDSIALILFIFNLSFNPANLLLNGFIVVLLSQNKAYSFICETFTPLLYQIDKIGESFVWLYLFSNIMILLNFNCYNLINSCRIGF